MIKVHHLNNSRSHRILWLLEELGLDYEIVRYQRLPSMLAPPELRRVHPLGKSPVVELENGRVLAESGAIIEYLVKQHAAGQLAPSEQSERYADYLYWLHYAEGSLMPPLLLKLVLGKMGPFGWPARGYVNRQLELHLSFLEGELAKGPYLVGDQFTGADIQLSFPLEAATARAGLDSSRPSTWGYLERLRARPGYKRALERGGALEL